MDFKSDVIAAIGNTPLIKLRKASELTGCTILGKAEFMNPGPIRQGPRRPVHHQGRDRQRHIETGRHHC